MFIVEPQWNPSVENQAIARALRIGQDKSVLVTRYVVELTVEEVSQRLCSHTNMQLTFQDMRKLQNTKLERAELVNGG